MLKTRVIPTLLLRNESFVKTVKFKAASYVGDPVNTVRIYNEKEVDEIIVLDITATIERRPPNARLIADFANECFMPLAYGGGIRSLKDMESLFALGVEKISLNTIAQERPSFMEEAAREFGSQAIVISIDVRKNMFGRYIVHTAGGRKSTGKPPVECAREAESRGAGELLLTAVDRDGTFEGYDLPLVSAVTSAVGIPVIACGGAGSIGDIGRVVREGGASAAAVGSMVVYQGKARGVLINFPSRAELRKVLS